MTLMQYINKHVEVGTALGDHVAWLYETDAAVSAEIWLRFTSMKPYTFRIGSRVYGVGLKKTVELNGQKGTITRRKGKRWGVLFDRDDTAPKALLPANLRAKPEIPQPSPRPHLSAEQTMHLLREATDWIEAQPTTHLRHDIHERIRLARQVLEGDACPVKCGEPLDIAPGYATNEYDMTPHRKEADHELSGERARGVLRVWQGTDGAQRGRHDGASVHRLAGLWSLRSVPGYKSANCVNML